MENILRIQFSGRLRRNRFWPTIITIAIINIVLSALGNMAFMEGSPIPPIVGGIALLAVFYLVLVGLGLAARRLHDTGRSGWWLLIGLIPYINMIGVIILIVFYCLDSKPGSNQWGPNPKELA